MARGSSTIKQRIALDGGAEIKKELAELGRVGEVAFAKLKKAAANDAGKSSLVAFQQQLSKVKTDLRALDLQAGAFTRTAIGLGKSFGDLGVALAAVGTRLLGVGAAIAGATVGLGALAANSAKVAAEVGEAASATGLSVEKYQALQFAAQQAGLDAGGFTAAMSRLNDAVGDARKGNEAAIEKFKALGVSVTGVNGGMKPLGTILAEIANKFAGMPDGIKKSALAIDLFGRAGAKLIPTLNGGAAGLLEFEKRLASAGLSLTAAQVKIADEADDALGLLKHSLVQLKTQIGLVFAPDLKKGSDALQKLLEENTFAIRAWTTVLRNEAMVVLTDFYNALAGDPSKVKNVWVLEWSVAILKFKQVVESTWREVIQPVFAAIGTAAEFAAQKLNEFFGTKLSGKELLVGAAILKLVGAFGLIGPAITIAIQSLTLLVSGFNLLVNVAKVAGSGLVLLVRGLALIPGAGALASGALTLLRGLALGAFRLIGEAAVAAAGVIGRAFVGLGVAAIWTAFVAGARKTFLDIGLLAIAATRTIGTAFIALGSTALFAPIIAAARAAWVAISAGALAMLAPAGALGALVGWPVLLAFAIGAAVVTIVLHFDSIKAAAAGLFEYLKANAPDLVSLLFKGATDLATYVAGKINPLKNVFDTLLQLIGPGSAKAADQAERELGGIGQNVSFDGLQAAFQAELGELKADVAATVQQIVEQFQGLGPQMAAAFQGLAAAVDAAFAGVVAAISGHMQAAVSIVQQSAAQMIAALNAVIARAREAAQAAAQAGGSGGGSGGSGDPGFATGGFVSGPGGPTADKIRAWLSDGEFVQSARAVRFWGRDFMEALNRLQIPSKLQGLAKGGSVRRHRQTKGGLPAFSAGGFVSGLSDMLGALGPSTRLPSLGSVSSAIAAGASQGMVPAVINIGGESIPVMAAPDAIDTFQRVATRRQIAATGRRPGWA